MTNKELDQARSEEAYRRLEKSGSEPVGIIAARLAREGWTPPVAVDPDLAEAEYMHKYGPNNEIAAILAGLKQGRALAAEAKPGLVWKRHGRLVEGPALSEDYILLRLAGGGMALKTPWPDKMTAWWNVTHYCEITPPEDVA